MQTFIHYFLHLVFPAIIAWLFFRKEWKKVYLIFLLTMLVDLDHLLATPIFQANRCSIGFHPLHSYYAIAGYVVLLFFRKPFNIIGIGLLFHMFTDLVDCLFTFSQCPDCLVSSPAYKLLLSIANCIGLN
ncbi:DUF6122 family protein [Mangrovibacterium lignilyticum]|uniref:DUF6122 family protein n=1 Tax=Mangrovibacterium lignilyticum TaxID=2668052 RepID=UPI0013D30E85|nr:DUF6122 family protein [Mangrovibacterium lignilyticum]